MPPARTIFRRNAFPVQDTQQQRLHDIKAPYNSYQQQTTSSGKKSTYQEDFMDLDEFLQKSSAVNIEGSIDNASSFEDADYQKPNVDLLASLRTLGKMIQNQKQLIVQQQQQQQHQPNHELGSEVPATIPVELPQLTAASQITTTPSLSPFIPNITNSSYIKSLTTNDAPSNPSKDLINFPYGSVPSENSIEKPKISSRNDKEENNLETDSSRSQVSSSSQRGVVPEEIKDIYYWDRRKRNNLAAKKSREERRRKELEILESAKLLEKENSQLATMLKRLTARNELLESRLQHIRKRQLKNGSSGTEEDSSTNSSLDTNTSS